MRSKDREPTYTFALHGTCLPPIGQLLYVAPSLFMTIVTAPIICIIFSVTTSHFNAGNADLISAEKLDISIACQNQFKWW